MLMNEFHPKNLHFFRECGRRGGLKRAKRLSASLRSNIASKAARARWKNKSSASSLMSSVRLDVPQMDDSVFLEELLSEGSLEEWRNVYQEILNRPFGSTASALEKVLSATTIYGVIPLWKDILRTVRGSFV